MSETALRARDKGPTVVIGLASPSGAVGAYRPLTQALSQALQSLPRAAFRRRPGRGRRPAALGQPVTIACEMSQRFVSLLQVDCMANEPSAVDTFAAWPWPELIHAHSSPFSSPE